MKFEKGDIVYWMGADKAFGIVIGDCEYFKGCYRLYVNGSYETHSSCSHKYLRYATHDEKGLLLTALAKENKYYCEKTKTIKEMKKEKGTKCTDWENSGGFTKKDLKSGMWVELRNGDRYMVIEDCDTMFYGKQRFCLITNDGYLTSDEYTDCLTCSDSEQNEFDICAVYSTSGDVINGNTYTGEDMNVIWERETEEAKQIKEMQVKLEEMKKAYNELEKNISETLDKLNGLKK